jgi:archaellum biogenesis protein FlaJ (TadC family)
MKKLFLYTYIAYINRSGVPNLKDDYSKAFFTMALSITCTFGIIMVITLMISDDVYKINPKVLPLVGVATGVILYIAYPFKKLDEYRRNNLQVYTDNYNKYKAFIWAIHIISVLMFLILLVVYRQTIG